MRPGIGSIVVYVARVPEGVERAAVITGVGGNDEDGYTYDGTVFVNEGREMHAHVERFFVDAELDDDEEPAPGTWHWPVEDDSDEE